MDSNVSAGPPASLDIAQQYFAAWNRRDPAAVLETMAPAGTYSDPTTGGPLSGEAFRNYMNGLFASFPDLSFDIASAGLAADDLVAAQWIMRGTNTGSMMGLPPTGKAVVLNGADFIRVTDGRIRSVDGYFDSRALPEQLGLQVVVQPHAIGPFTFGVSTRVSVGSMARPGAFSITALQPRDADDVATVRELSRRVAAELPSMRGFIGWVGTTIGDRMLTITAWENADDPRQLMKGGHHGEAMKQFFGGDVGDAAYTSIFVADRINPMWVRCRDCRKMNDHTARQGTCACGAALPQPIAYW